jgi:transcriptional regulator with XRE-family HTH domain
VAATDLERFLDAVGRRISELRERAGLSQAEVAEKLGTTVSNYQRIEHGLQNTTLAMVLKISHIIGVEPIEILAPPKSRRRRRRGRPRKTP